MKTIHESGTAHFVCLVVGLLVALPELHSSVIAYLLVALIVSVMGIISLVDIFTKEIYHSHMWMLLTVNLLLFAYNTYRFGFSYTVDCLLGASALFAFLFAVCKLSKLITGRQGLGEGDCKLMGILGLWLGIRKCFLALSVGSVCASVVILLMTAASRKDDSEDSQSYPFAPFLCFGTLFAYLFADKLTYMFTEFLMKLWS